MCKTLRKRILPLLLTLALTAGLLAVPAAAAPADPTAALANVAYYGRYESCGMPCDMANGYGKALASLAGDEVYALLADPAGDGMPLLITVSRSAAQSQDRTLSVWEWNGIEAVAHDFRGDSVLGWNFGFDFGIYDRLEAAIRVGDGVGIAIGDACGYLYYAVENAQLSAIRHTMTYTAENFGGTAQGTLLPLTGATGAMYDQKAPVSALVQAGWTKIDGYDAYQLVSVDGQYQFFSSYAAQSRWLEEDEARFAPSTNQIFAASTGESELLGKWSTGAELRAALTAYARKAAAESGDFFDVPSSHWAYPSVRWAVEQGITNGTSATTFSPNTICTTAQILTFLWRANGQPAGNLANPFVDVSASDYYYQAALWAASRDLARGQWMEPNGPCTRAQTVYYLWQLAGSPMRSGQTKFRDVPADMAYAPAVQWAVEQGITDGTSETTFSPLSTCTRGQIVTFLYRAYH